MSRLFSPVRVGAFTARTRTWVPAMVPWRSTEEGDATPEVVDWYGRFADGRPGVLVVEATGIRDVPSGPLLRIGSDRFVPGLRRLVEEVRERSAGETRLLVQLIDFLSIRRRPDRERFLGRFLEIQDRHRAAVGLEPGATEDSVREALLALDEDGLRGALSARELEALEYGARERVTDTHLPHIAELPRTLPGLFADAASRAMAAGFDGVELHFAHAYTMASFLSARNTREDGYGGSRGSDPARSRSSPPSASASGGAREVGCRMLGDEVIEGGTRIDDAAWFGGPLRRGRHGLRLGQQGRQVRGRSSAEGRRRGLSLHRGERARVHADRTDRCARPVRPEPAALPRHPRSRPRRGAGGARRRMRGDRDLPRSGGRARPRRLRHRRRCATVPRRPRLVAQGLPGPGRARASVPLHELLRGARPEAQGGHLPALGSPRAR